jgi:hypothetical protein
MAVKGSALGAGYISRLDQDINNQKLGGGELVYNSVHFKFFVCLHGDKTYNSLFVETPRKFITEIKKIK